MSIDLHSVNLNGETVDLTVRDGRIAAITPSDGTAKSVIMPLPVEPHVHLDKTFTINRCANIKPGLFGAIEATNADKKHWTEADLRTRAQQGLSEAHSNGLSALRTHVDWSQTGVPLAWSVVAELDREWTDKLTVQRVALAPLDLLGDPDIGPKIAEHVAATGGVLGAFIYQNEDLDTKLERVFRLAEQHDFLLDFHVDEGLDQDACGFDAVVALTVKYGMAGRVLCGHACSLSVRPQDDVARVMDAAADAGVALTVLPTTNLHLQDMAEGRSPRLRGLAPMQDLRAAGVTVLLGADNVADPFYPRGCYDAIETLRLACLAGHLNPADWIGAISTNAARVMGLDAPDIAIGAPADFMLIQGRDWDDALRSPTAQRRIIRSGQNTTIGKDAA
ncbi:amidohydrolase family protein [Pacificibacter marinus]|uniref:amidohydrolase family protein n=1 Tax=Pacificibacter marinus TaxID=658057 RepID=UPI001C0712FA|nr:amidohydrolase family protein [Pacificibacter marinus]